jgi:hypothetical protein
MSDEQTATPEESQAAVEKARAPERVPQTLNSQRAEREAKATKVRVIAVLSLAAVLMVVAGIMFANIIKGSDEPEKATATNEPTVASESDQQLCDDNPLDELGCLSWTQFLEKAMANPVMWQALWKVRPDLTQEAVAQLVASEANGASYVAEASPGTVITNTGTKNGSAFTVSGYVVKAGDTLFLTDGQGTITVKVSCGNPVKPGKPEKPKVTEECPLRNSDPNGTLTPHHPNSPTYYNPPAPPNPEAPNYVPGNAEAVEGNRGTGDGQSGGLGDGNGNNTTPGGTTNGDDGSSETNDGSWNPDTTSNSTVTTNTAGPPG